MDKGKQFEHAVCQAAWNMAGLSNLSSRKRSDYDIAFVYYAGHGVQVGAENFLLPTKVNFETEYDVMDFGVSVQNIMRYCKIRKYQQCNGFRKHAS